MKRLKRILIVLLLSFGFYESKSQNLISNGSFELLNMPINWGTWGGGFFDNSVFPEQQIVSNWNVFNSPDYFTSDYPNANKLYGQPINLGGSSNTKTGKAYAGIYIYKKSSENKEYIYQHLNQPLQADSNYCLSFFTSRADRFPFSIKKLGAYFSINVPNLITNQYISVIPQVVNTSVFLTDTINWVEIQGCFTAAGGEQYVTIGNFNNNVNTDTLRIPSTNPLNGTGTDVAYYYIDSVSLWQNNFPTKVNEFTKVHTFLLYPNPNNGTMQFNYSVTKKAEFIITDVTGRIVTTYILDETQRSIVIKEQELNAGVYFYTIKQSNKILKQDKIIVMR